MAEIIINPAAETTVPVDIVCGNAETDTISFVFDRFDAGNDLAGLAWAVTVKNAAGFADVYMPGMGILDVQETNDTITIRWRLYGTATSAAGRMLYQLEGTLGKAVIKRFPVHVINILSYVSAQLSDDAEADNSNLHETIEYVGLELPKILAAEAKRAEDFAKVDLYVEKSGRVTRMTAVNTQGVKTIASVLDGEKMAIRAIYDSYAEMIAAHPTGYLGDIYAVHAGDEAELYFWDLEKKAWVLLGSFEVALPESFVVDSVVTENGENAVSGAAVHVFVENSLNARLPVPKAEDAGKFLRVDENGALALMTVGNAEEVGF